MEELTLLCWILIFPRRRVLNVCRILERTLKVTVHCELAALHTSKVNLLFKLRFFLHANLLILMRVVNTWTQSLFIDKVRSFSLRKKDAGRFVKRVYLTFFFIALSRRGNLSLNSTK